MVTVQATLDQTGKVAELRVTRAQLSQIPGPQNSALERTTTDALGQAAATAVRQWEFEAPVSAPLTFPVVLTFMNGTIQEALAPPIIGRGGGTPTAQPPLAPWPAAEGAYRIGGSIAPPGRTKDVKPTYPREAQRAGVQGIVIVELLIGPNGKVRDAHVLRSVPPLDKAALDAVRKWEFTPTMVNGVAVPVVMSATLTFTLNY